MSDIEERFQGDGANRHIVEALNKNLLFNGLAQSIEQVCEKGELVIFNSGKSLIKQEDEDNDIYFLLFGEVDILVNDRKVATRKAGQHVGEMVLIDPTTVRSATVKAVKKVVALKLSESIFVNIAEQTPALWRGLASELADRIRQRNSLVEQRNTEPRIFIGSTVEKLPVARAIQKCFEHDNFIVKVWENQVFESSTYPVESLIKETKECDFAILLFSPDDTVSSREKIFDAPRDNIVFELGLFMGALGRERIFIVSPKGKDIKIPSDLTGITILTYKEPERAEDNISSISVIVDEIRQKVSRLEAK